MPAKLKLGDVDCEEERACQSKASEWSQFSTLSKGLADWSKTPSGTSILKRRASGVQAKTTKPGQILNLMGVDINLNLMDGNGSSGIDIIVLVLCFNCPYRLLDYPTCVDLQWPGALLQLSIQDSWLSYMCGPAVAWCFASIVHTGFLINLHVWTCSG